MSGDVFATLQNLRRFLESEVLDAIPASQRSELRAAIKTLADVEQDFDLLPERLPGECSRLLGLCSEALSLLNAKQAIDPALAPLADRYRALLQGSDRSLDRMRERFALHAEVRKLGAGLIALLQPAETEAAARALLRRFYTELQAQADARRGGQSVFSVSRNPPSTPRGASP